MFAAIVAKFLRSLAAVKLENGAAVLTLEYLLNSRTVFSALTAPLSLRALPISMISLMVLWALSPLGSQASLRVISTEPGYTVTSNNFSYLAFASPFGNEGQGSPSAEPLIPSDAIFTAALISSADSKASHQDPYGNIKVPIYDSLPQASSLDATGWREVPETGVVWSSLVGIPLQGLSSTGVSNFSLNTGYMTSQCQVSGQAWSFTNYLELDSFNYTSSFGGWSGANFVVEAVLDELDSTPASFVFRAIAPEFQPGKNLTVANCTVYMDYVEVQVQCNSSTCRSLAARPATDPASHIGAVYLAHPSWLPNTTIWTPFNGLAQTGTQFTSFWKDFVNATNPYIGCDTSFCPLSLVEGYLLDPNNAVSPGGTSYIHERGSDLISQRLTQLINTYWIVSIAPYDITGNFTRKGAAVYGYNTDSDVGSVQIESDVIKCDTVWLAILLLCSLAMFLCGIAGAVLGLLRRGPDILDQFGSLLRGNPYVRNTEYSSMDDAVDLSRRLRDVKVRLGDVSPEEDTGQVAIGSLEGDAVVKRLSTRRMYR